MYSYLYDIFGSSFSYEPPIHPLHPGEPQAAAIIKYNTRSPVNMSRKISLAFFHHMARRSAVLRFRKAKED